MTEIPILVCGRVIGGKLLLADNLTGHCDLCNHLVQFRPHAPDPRILRCMQCALPLIEPGDEVSISERMLEDAKDYFRRLKQ